MKQTQILRSFDLTLFIGERRQEATHRQNAHTTPPSPLERVGVRPHTDHALIRPHLSPPERLGRGEAGGGLAGRGLLLIFSILLATSSLFARDGYHITLKMPEIQDSMVYLVHYYGQNRPHIYLSDSARFDKKGTAIFDSKDPDFVGGIYIILLKDSVQTNFEILLNKGDELTVSARFKDLPDGVIIKGSPENERFMSTFAADQKKLTEEFKNAKTAADTASVRAKATASSKARNKYTRDYAKAYPNTLLANVFNAMEVPEVPEVPHFLEDGKTKDSTFAYKYYKAHYWDNFNFKDDRLIFTPIFDAKIEEYITKLTLPWPDSMEKESDMLLAKVRGTKDLFHYTLWWLTHNVDNSKVMGMDEVFVYLVENYYMKGDAFWLKSDELAKYIERAMAIAPNVIGNVAPPVKTVNLATKKPESMNDIMAKYTLLVFYSPTCGHCEHEIPLLDSVYEALLKDKGVKIFTVATEGEEKQITDFLARKKVDKKWINTWDPEHKSDCRTKYDVYSTPTIYLMDDKKIIKGKRLDHSNIAGLVEMLEKKAALKT
jgi:thiol-disulfide isomerase/thioredoxin